MKKNTLFLLIITCLSFLSFALKNGSGDYWEIMQGADVKVKFNPKTENFDSFITYSKR